MGVKSLRPVILIFIIIAMAVPLLIAAANTQAPQTGLSYATNESLDISSARLAGNNINNYSNFSVKYNITVTSNSPISGFFMTNATGDVITAGGNYTLNTTSGAFQLINSTYWVSGNGKYNTTLLNYQYYDVNYLDDGTVRSISPLILFFGALGILITVVAAMYKDELLELISRY